MPRCTCATRHRNGVVYPKLILLSYQNVGWHRQRTGWLRHHKEPADGHWIWRFRVIILFVLFFFSKPAISLPEAIEALIKRLIRRRCARTLSDRPSVVARHCGRSLSSSRKGTERCHLLPTPFCFSVRFACPHGRIGSFPTLVFPRVLHFVVCDLRQCVTNCVVYHRICIEEPTHNHSEPSFWLRRSTSFAEPGAPGNVSPQDYIGALQCMSCVLSNAGNDISAVWTYPIVW